MAERKKAFAEARVAENTIMNEGSPKPNTKQHRGRDLKKVAKRIEDEKERSFVKELNSVRSAFAVMNVDSKDDKRHDPEEDGQLDPLDDAKFDRHIISNPGPQYDELALDGRFGDRKEAMEQLGDINELNVVMGKRPRRIAPTPVIDFNDLRQPIPKDEPMELEQRDNEVEDPQSLSKMQRRKARKLKNIEKEKAKQVSAKERKAARSQARRLRENKTEARPGGDRPSTDLIMQMIGPTPDPFLPLEKEYLDSGTLEFIKNDLAKNAAFFRSVCDPVHVATYGEESTPLNLQRSRIYCYLEVVINSFESWTVKQILDETRRIDRWERRGYHVYKFEMCVRKTYPSGAKSVQARPGARRRYKERIRVEREKCEQLRKNEQEMMKLFRGFGVQEREVEAPDNMEM